MSKPRIPFGWLPGHWGLKGKTKEIAQAEYELTGYDLERRLIQIQDPEDLDLRLNDLDLEHGKVTQEEHNTRRLALLPQTDDNRLEKIEHDFKYKKITKNDRDKLRADVLGEAWVNIISIEIDPNDPSKGNFELDWNDKFVEELRESGYEGVSDEEVIDLWVSTLCKHIALEEFNGHGSIDGLGGEEPILSKQRIDDDRWIIK